MLRMLALALCAPLTGAKLIEAHFNGLVTQYAHADHDMAYLGKFAFQCVGECGRHYGNKLSSDDTTHMLSYESGMVRVVAHGGYEPGQVLAVFLSENFYDRTRSWRNVFKNRKLTCAQKLEKAVDVIQLSPAPPPNASSTYDEEHLFDDQTVQRTEYIELTARPQFFHFAAMNCQRGSLYTYIELKLFNPGSFRTRHFSFEDQGLLGLETTMCAPRCCPPGAAIGGRRGAPRAGGKEWRWPRARGGRQHCAQRARLTRLRAPVRPRTGWPSRRCWRCWRWRACSRSRATGCTTHRFSSCTTPSGSSSSRTRSPSTSTARTRPLAGGPSSPSSAPSCASQRSGMRCRP